MIGAGSDGPPPGTDSGSGRADDGGAPDVLSQLGRHAGHGFTIAAATALFAWLGGLLDDRAGTAPLFVILGAFLGFGAGFYSMIRSLLPPSADGDGDGGEEGGEEGGP